MWMHVSNKKNTPEKNWAFWNIVGGKSRGYYCESYNLTSVVLKVFAPNFPPGINSAKNGWREIKRFMYGLKNCMQYREA